MSNDLKSNPAVIDTALSTSSTLNGGNEAALDEIYWFNPTASGDTFTVTLGDGAQILRTGRCESANQSQVFQMYGRRVTAIQVPTLTSGGKLYISWHWRGRRRTTRGIVCATKAKVRKQHRRGRLRPRLGSLSTNDAAARAIDHA
jgi:hypothetical protein